MGFSSAERPPSICSPPPFQGEQNCRGQCGGKKAHLRTKQPGVRLRLCGRCRVGLSEALCCPGPRSPESSRCEIRAGRRHHGALGRGDGSYALRAPRVLSAEPAGAAGEGVLGGQGSPGTGVRSLHWRGSWAAGQPGSRRPAGLKGVVLAQEKRNKAKQEKEAKMEPEN